MLDRTGNLPPLPGIFPDYAAPIVRKTAGWARTDDGASGNAVACVCVEGPKFKFRRDERSQRGLACIGADGSASSTAVSCRSQASPRPSNYRDSRPPVWFALDATRPLAFFAGIWTRWTSIRKVKEGETTNDLFAFLTTEPNKMVGAFHPKAMPVILTTLQEIDTWMTAPAKEALQLQRPLADNAIVIVARGEKEDKGGVAA